MIDQKKEEELYTAIGNYLVKCLTSNKLEKKWDEVILEVKHSHGVTDYEANYIFKDKYRNLDLMLPSITPIVSQIKSYTTANNYTPWNKFKFELFANYKFNIEYEWDQDLFDEHEKTQS